MKTKFEDFINESKKLYGLGKERMIKFLEKIAEMDGYRFAYEIVHDIRNNHLNIEPYKTNYILFDNQEMRVGKFFKKYFSNKTAQEIEKLVYLYNGFLIDTKKEKFKEGEIVFQFTKHGKKSKFLSFNISFDKNVYSVLTKDIRRIIGQYSNALREYSPFDKDILHYLEYMGYRFNEQFFHADTTVYIIKFDNEKDLYDFVQLLTNPDRDFIDKIKKTRKYNI